MSCNLSACEAKAERLQDWGQLQETMPYKSRKGNKRTPSVISEAGKHGKQFSLGPIWFRAMNTHLSFNNGLGSIGPSPACTRYTHISPSHAPSNPRTSSASSCIRQQHIPPSLNNDISFLTLVAIIFKQFLFTCIPSVSGDKESKGWLGLNWYWAHV